MKDILFPKNTSDAINMPTPSVSPFWIKVCKLSSSGFEASTFNFQLGSAFKIKLYLFPRVAFLSGAEILFLTALYPLGHFWSSCREGGLCSASSIVLTNWYLSDYIRNDLFSLALHLMSSQLLSRALDSDISFALAFHMLWKIFQILIYI